MAPVEMGLSCVAVLLALAVLAPMLPLSVATGSRSSDWPHSPVMATERCGVPLV